MNMSSNEVHRFVLEIRQWHQVKEMEKSCGDFFSDRVLSVIVPVVDLIRRNSLKFTRNSTRKAMHPTTASKTVHSSQRSFSFSIFRYAFDTFDTNDDGTIDFNEFLLSIAATSQGNLDDRLAVAFDLYVSLTPSIHSLFSFFIDTTSPMMEISIKRN